MGIILLSVNKLLPFLKEIYLISNNNVGHN